MPKVEYLKAALQKFGNPILKTLLAVLKSVEMRLGCIFPSGANTNHTIDRVLQSASKPGR